MFANNVTKNIRSYKSEVKYKYLNLRWKMHDLLIIFFIVLFAFRSLKKNSTCIDWSCLGHDHRWHTILPEFYLLVKPNQNNR